MKNSEENMHVDIGAGAMSAIFSKTLNIQVKLETEET